MPQLSLDAPIGFFDEVKSLSPGHPVFLISCGDDDSNLVIKKEIGSVQQALKHNLKIMSQVSPSVSGSKLLTMQEVESLRSHVRAAQVAAAHFGWAETADIGDLRNCLATSGTWYKMKKVSGIQGLDSAINQLRNNRDKTGVRAIAKSLNDPGGFEKLGQIMAVDLYNHNLDRFTWFGGGVLNPLNNVKFKAICNIGNVLIATEHGELKPVGLDSFFPGSEYKRVDQPLADLFEESALKEKWGGYLLARNASSLRRKFAEDVFDDLQNALGPRDRKFFLLSKKRLNSNGPSRMLTGIEKAIEIIRQKLEVAVKKPNAPVGLIDRLAIIQ